MRRETIAGLDVVLTGGEDREGGGSGPLVVLLHGFGAPGTDLVGLQRALDVPREVRFAFPAAPIELAMFPGMDARAWWRIDMEAMQRAIARGELRDLSAQVPEGLPEAREAVDALLDALTTRLAPSALVIGGFSQGAMLSADVALHGTRRLAGLVQLSGTLVAEREWSPRLRGRAGLRVFQSHGTHDAVLPFSIAERLRDAMTTAGLDVTFVPFRGGHEIPMPVLAGLATFLRGTTA